MLKNKIRVTIAITNNLNTNRMWINRIEGWDLTGLLEGWVVWTKSFGVDSQMKIWRVEFVGSSKDALITDRVIPVGSYEFKIPHLFISSACIQSVSEGMRYNHTGHQSWNPWNLVTSIPICVVLSQTIAVQTRHLILEPQLCNSALVCLWMVQMCPTLVYLICTLKWHLPLFDFWFTMCYPYRWTKAYDNSRLAKLYN